MVSSRRFFQYLSSPRQQEQLERKHALKPTLSKENENLASNDNSMLLLLSLTYLRAAQRLAVTVNRARNLPLADRKGRLGKLSVFPTASTLHAPLFVTVWQAVPRKSPINFKSFSDATYRRTGLEMFRALSKPHMIIDFALL